MVIQQPALAAYRIPVFRELAARPGIDLKIAYSSEANLKNVEPDGFEAEWSPTRIVQVGPRVIVMHRAQIEHATRSRCDVLILNWNVHNAWLVPALLRARVSGVGTALWGHGYSRWEASWRRAGREGVARLADALILYNHTRAGELRERGFRSERVFVALNSLDQSAIREARADWLARPRDLATFQEENGLAGRRNIIFVSRFQAANRLDLLVRAVGRVKLRVPEVQLILIGEGEPERARLEQLTAELGLSEHVRFAGAVYGQPAIAPWFLSSDVFCYPANIGLSILHAMGYGLPVVTGDEIASHNPEIEALQDGQNGLLFEHGNPESLAAQLEKLLQNEGLRARLSARALATTKTFDIPIMVDGFVEAIEFAASRH